MNNMAAPPTAAPKMTAVLFGVRGPGKDTYTSIREIPFSNKASEIFTTGVFLCTFRRGLKLFLHTGAWRVAIAAQGLNPEQIDGTRSQITDLHRVLLKTEYGVCSHTKVIILGDRGSEVTEKFSLPLNMEATDLISVFKLE